MIFYYHTPACCKYFLEYTVLVNENDSAYTLGDSGDCQTLRYQGIEKATVSRVLENFMFKIS